MERPVFTCSKPISFSNLYQKLMLLLVQNMFPLLQKMVSKFKNVFLLVGNLLLLLKERVLASRKSVSTSKENSFYRWKYTFPRMITQPVIIGHQDIPRTPSSAFVKDLIWSSFPYLTFQGRFKPTYQENILKTFSEFILVELQMVP